LLTTGTKEKENDRSRNVSTVDRLTSADVNEMEEMTGFEVIGGSFIIDGQPWKGFCRGEN